MTEKSHETPLTQKERTGGTSKAVFSKRRLAKLYDIIMIMLLVELSGCGGVLHRFLSMGDYGVEKFIRGAGGIIVFLSSGVVGAMLLFATSAARSTDETAKRKMIGVILLIIGVYIMFLRFYLNFHYAGRKTPY